MKSSKASLLCLCLSMLICGSAFAADPPEPKFRAQTIDDKIQIGYGVVVADVDGDKKPDILLADKKQFVWYRNPPTGTRWEKFVIAENLTKRDNVCLAAQDIDGDGKCELAVGGDWDPNDRENSGAVFYMIAPEDRTHQWEAVKLHAEPTVHRMRWMKIEEGEWGLIVAPLHGRGREGTAGSKIMLYKKPADPHAEWATEVLDDSMHETHNFEVMQPFLLLIVGREGALGVGRRVHDGIPQYLKPKPTNVQRAGEVRECHGLIATIEPMHGNQLVVYLKGERKVLTDQMIEGHALACSEFWKDRLPQVVAGWRGGNGGIRFWTALDDGAKWRESIIDDGGMACEDLCLADLNGDGKLDIIASGRATHNVKVYWNETGK